MKFWTTAPTHATAHMERQCDHEFKHPPCTRRTESGVLKTRATAAYTNTLVRMLVAVVAIMAGHISGGDAFTTDASVGMSTVAWAEQAIKHDVFWASEYARDEGYIPPMTCSEWADVEWEVTDAHECYMMRKRLQMYWAKKR